MAQWTENKFGIYRPWMYILTLPFGRHMILDKAFNPLGPHFSHLLSEDHCLK